MKSLLPLSLCALLFLCIFNACEKEAVTNSSNKEMSNDALTQISQQQIYQSNNEFYTLNPDIATKIKYSEYILLDESIQRAIYDKMPTAKRLNFWKAKFQQNLKNDQLSANVKLYMNQFIDDIDLATFISKEEMSKFNNLVEEKLTGEEKAYFASFSSISGIDKALEIGDIHVVAGGDCTMRWCTLCPRKHIDMGIQQCTSNCKATQSGCGLWWEEACNKICEYIPL